MIFKYEGWMGGGREREGGGEEGERQRQRATAIPKTDTHTTILKTYTHTHTKPPSPKTNLEHVLTVDMSKSLKCRLQVVECLKVKQQKCHSS